MYDARFTGQVIARGDRIELVYGNPHSPTQGVKVRYLRPSDKNSFCPCKGAADYSSVNVEGLAADKAVWPCGHPSDAARQDTDHIALWHDVVRDPAAATH